MGPYLSYSSTPGAPASVLREDKVKYSRDSDDNSKDDFRMVQIGRVDGACRSRFSWSCFAGRSVILLNYVCLYMYWF